MQKNKYNKHEQVFAGIGINYKHKKAELASVIKGCLLLVGISVFTQSGRAQEAITVSGPSSAQVVQMAQAQFQQGDFQGCVQTLQPVSSAFTGEIAFDRLWGLCAHGSGDYNSALLAYNRILWQQNTNAEIRLEHARVLYDLGFYQKSRDEFRWLLGKNPPPNARVAINNYLNAIAAKLPKVKQHTRLSVSSVVGHDDNVNAAPLLEDFLGFSIDPDSQALDSAYTSLKVSFMHLQTLSPDSGLKISSGLSMKHFPDAGVFDQGIAMLGLGYQQLYARSSFEVDVLAYGLDVDGHLNGKGLLSNTRYHYQYTPQVIVSPYVSLNVLRFSDQVEIKNVNQYALGSALQYKLDPGGRHTLGMDYSFGHDNPVNVDSNYELDFHKLKLDYRLKLQDSLTVSTQLAYDIFDFDAVFFPLAFSAARKDKAWTLSSGLDWSVNERWTISPLVSYRDFASNVDIYAYERGFIELKASYQWLW